MEHTPINELICTLFAQIIIYSKYIVLQIEFKNNKKKPKIIER